MANKIDTKNGAVRSVEAIAMVRVEDGSIHFLPGVSFPDGYFETYEDWSGEEEEFIYLRHLEKGTYAGRIGIGELETERGTREHPFADSEYDYLHPGMEWRRIEIPLTEDGRADWSRISHRDVRDRHERDELIFQMQYGDHIKALDKAKAKAEAEGLNWDDMAYDIDDMSKDDEGLPVVFYYDREEAIREHDEEQRRKYLEETRGGLD